MEDEMMPLPSEEATPPVTKMYFVSPTIIMFLYLVYSLCFTTEQEVPIAFLLKKRKSKKKGGEPKYFMITFSLKFIISSFLSRICSALAPLLLRFYGSGARAKVERSKTLAKATRNFCKGNALPKTLHRTESWHKFCCLFGKIILIIT